MNEQQNSFFDYKTLFAIILVGLVWFQWEKHLQTKYPSYNKPAANSQKPEDQPGIVAATKEAVKEEIKTTDPLKSRTVDVPEEKQVPEELVHYEDSVWKFDFSSNGMGLKNIFLKTMSDRSGNLIQLGDSSDHSPLETHLIDVANRLNFKISKISDTEFVGKANILGMEISKTVKVNSDRTFFNVAVSATNLRPEFKGFLTYMADRIALPEQKGFFQRMFFPSYDMPEYVVVSSGTTERHMFMDDTAFEAKSYNQVSHYSFGSHYFAMALVDQSAVMPTANLSMNAKEKTFLGTLRHQMINPTDKFEIQFLAYAGPKKLDVLSSVDPKLQEVVNYGFFGFLSRPMLKIMHAFYDVFKNWGMAIILLTLLVRLFVLPFNIMSYKSIKAMQTIQPLLKQLQEKYKDNRQELNLATMKLMKDHKVNPLGGCLPMLLQLPVFFALYQVFGQSIELYKAPFVLWIQDLSAKDPFYVLPIGMAATMFVQQKMMPSTMDPQQAKVMMFVPVLFSLMMLNLPSALNLYIFVSSLFAVIQQIYFMNDKKQTNKDVILAKAKLVEK